MASSDGSHTARTPLEEFLALQDAPCPGCGYNLRGMRGDRCSECGGLVTLERLKNWFPRGAYITGLVGISLGLLAHFLAIIVLLQFFAPFAHETMGGWAILYALLAGIATLLVLLGLWYWGRFRIGHFRPIVRWMLAVLLFPVAIGGIVLALMMG